MTYKLKASCSDSDGTAGGNYGSSVACYGDWAAIGCPDSGGGRDVELRRRGDGTWTVVQTIQNVMGGGFNVMRTARVISMWGDWLAIGDISYNGIDVGTGAVYMYKRAGETWSLAQTLQPSDASGSSGFGYAVCVKGDWLAIGATNVSSNTGKAYLFKNTAGTWAEDEILTASDAGVGDYYGNSVSIHAGDSGYVWAAVGAPMWDGSGKTNCGAVYMYLYDADAGTWSEDQIVQGAAAGDEFGLAVDVYDVSLVVGAPYSGTEAGTVYSYDYEVVAEVGDWNLGLTYQPDTIGDYDYLGTSVSIYDDTIAAGAIESYGLAQYSSGGYAVVLQRHGSVWQEESVLYRWPERVSLDCFGASVCVHGSAMVVGAPQATVRAGGIGDDGAAYVYSTLGSSVALGLTEASGRHFNLYLKIDGLEPILWQHSWRGEPSGWSRSIKTCLRATSEQSMGLDLGEMRIGLDAMSFQLDDAADTDGNSYFGKLFAPARYDSGDYTHVLKGTATGQQIDANETTIPVLNSSVASSGSYVHVGQETVYVGSVGPLELIDCVRGMYPCVGTRWSYTIDRPADGDSGTLATVSEHPYSWLGRRVALYLTAWSEQSESWCNESDSELLWVGRIADRIVQRGGARTWELSCKSILDDLDKQIGNNFPATVLLDKINLLGEKGRSFLVLAYEAGAEVARCAVEVPKGLYSPSALAAEINERLGPSHWTGSATGHVSGGKLKGASGDATKFALVLYAGMASPFGPVYRNITFSVLWDYDKGWMCHAMRALGFSPGAFVSVLHADSSTGIAEIAAGPMYRSYHPLHPLCNGGKMYVTGMSQMWIRQGDGATSCACVGIRDAFKKSFSDERWTAFCRYTNKTEQIDGLLYLTIDHLYTPAGEMADSGAFAGRTDADGPVEIRQAYVPQITNPFELLLYPLFSTGTSGYNGDYDALPTALSIGIPSALVDAQSFLDADKSVQGSGLAPRKFYPIAWDEPISWRDLAQRECVLFGHAVAWRNGKICLIDVASPDEATYDVTIDESVRSRPDEWPDVDMSVDTVVNQYECEINYNPTTGKYGPKVVVIDVDSVAGLQVTKSVAVKHPGVWISAQGETPIADLLGLALRGRYLRHPSEVVTVSAVRTLIGRVWPGDVVRYVSTRTMDPSGSGTRTTSCLATVTNASWDFGDHGFVGTLTLLLHAHNAGQGDPWCASALVDRDKDGSGWDKGYHAVDQKLYLEGIEFGKSSDAHDGETFDDGYAVTVIERAPADPSGPLSWSTTCSGDFAAGALTLTDALAGWDNTKEYVVVFAPFTSATATQLDEGTWMASPANELMSDASKPQRWG